MQNLKNLQVQLYQMSETTFNGVSLFGNYTTANGSTEVKFGGSNTEDITVSIFTSATEGGSLVSINKSMLCQH